MASRTSLQTLPQSSAVLDLHFSPQLDQGDLVAAVSSTATLSILRLSPSSSPLSLIATSRVDGIREDVLFLSCAWHPSLRNFIAVTTSTHKVYILQLSPLYEVVQTNLNPIITHSLEAWCVAMAPSGSIDNSRMLGFAVYSGGDDSLLCYTTCTMAQSVNKAAQEIEMPYPVRKVKGHDAGVTAILPLPYSLADGAHIVATGSYDDNLRIWSLPEQNSNLRPQLLATRYIGGGVWRLKITSCHQEMTRCDERRAGWEVRILASCMHAGARVIRVRGDLQGACSVEVLARFERHKSMNYGSDAQPGVPGSPSVCVSTSFYDRLLCLWEVANSSL